MVSVCCLGLIFFSCLFAFFLAISARQSEQETLCPGVEIGVNTQVELKELESGWGFSLGGDQALGLILSSRGWGRMKVNNITI